MKSALSACVWVGSVDEPLPVDVSTSPAAAAGYERAGWLDTRQGTEDHPLPFDSIVGPDAFGVRGDPRDAPTVFGDTSRIFGPMPTGEFELRWVLLNRRVLYPFEHYVRLVIDLFEHEHVDLARFDPAKVAELLDAGKGILWRARVVLPGVMFVAPNAGVALRDDRAPYGGFVLWCVEPGTTAQVRRRIPALR